jgi:hypothetical protein
MRIQDTIRCGSTTLLKSLGRIYLWKKTNVSELRREVWHMALLPDIEAKYEDLFIQFLNQPAVFAKLQGETK